MWCQFYCKSSATCTATMDAIDIPGVDGSFVIQDGKKYLLK